MKRKKFTYSVKSIQSQVYCPKYCLGCECAPTSHTCLTAEGHVPAEVFNAAPQQRMLLLVGQARKVPSCLLLAPAAPLEEQLTHSFCCELSQEFKRQEGSGHRSETQWGVLIIVIMLNLVASSFGFLGSEVNRCRGRWPASRMCGKLWLRLPEQPHFGLFVCLNKTTVFNYTIISCFQSHVMDRCSLPVHIPRM